MSTIIDTSRFSNFEQNGVWPHINRDDLLRDLTRSLESPELVAQQPLPGSIAVAEFISRSPNLYITQVHKLWSTGTVLLKSRCIHSPSWLKQTKPSQDMNTDAWIFSTSILNGDSVIETNSLNQWLSHRIENLHLCLLFS